MTFDPAFFADMIDFESGRYDTRSRRRSARNSSSSQRSGSGNTNQATPGNKIPDSLPKGNIREYVGDSNIKPSFWVVW